MGSLITLCPNTRAAIDTGIKTDYASLAKSWGKSIVVRCPHCTEEHAIKVREAFVKSEISDFFLGRQSVSPSPRRGVIGMSRFGSSYRPRASRIQ
jgi:hypothetical protein